MAQVTTIRDRREYTLRLLQESGYVAVAKLSETLGVSEVTIRKDLSQLEAEGVVARMHGGAVLADHLRFDLPFDGQAAKHAGEKARIGAAAARRVRDGDTLLLGAGTTTAQVARHLGGRTRLTVLTDSILIAQHLLGDLEVEVVLLGGVVRPTTASVIGPYAERMLEDYSVRHCFLSVDGHTPETGFTTTGTLVAHLFRSMMRAAAHVTIVSDASKFGRQGLSRICETGDVDRVISDVGLGDTERSGLEAAGVEVELV